MRGESLSSIIAQNPGFFMMHSKQILSFRSLLQEQNLLQNLRSWPSLESLASVEEAALGGQVELSAGGITILSWLAINLGCQRPFKAKQLYVHGPPNLGKTTLVRFLSDFFPTYVAPMEETFFDLYDEEVHKLVVFDEFKGQHKLTFMNQFLQGGFMTLRKKGTQAVKRANLPCVILSNHSPREAYSNVSEAALDAFLARLEVVELCSPIFGLLELLEQLAEEDD